MDGKNSVVIIIPLYKDELTSFEKISLEQVFKVLGNYDICYVVPADLNYEYIYAARIELFEHDYFHSTRSYNKLMLNKEFYKRFLDYEYMLIYQLDAFVFSDQLLYFCKLGYDYIGAPWLSAMSGYINGIYYKRYVGNGGLSLRKVDKCIELLNDHAEFLQDYSFNEDFFFAVGNDNFTVAPIEVALRFSFEREVEKCYEENHYNIPFGCHAWERYNLPFWREHIESWGYVLGEDDVKNGNGDRYNKQSAYLELIDKGRNGEKLERALINLFQSKNKIYTIWGAGEYGTGICMLFMDLNIDIDYVIDSDPKLKGSIICGHKIVDINTYKKNGECNIIIALKNYYMEVAQRLEELGYEYKKDYVFYWDLLEERK